MKKNSAFFVAMTALLEIYYLKLSEGVTNNHAIEMNINQFMNAIYDKDAQRCRCSLSEQKITVFQPYVIGSRKYQINEEFKIIRSPEKDDQQYDKYDIYFNIDKDIDYLIDLISELKNTLGSTQFNLVEYKQTITIKKENRGARHTAKSLNEKNDREVFRDVVKFIDENIFNFHIEDILPGPLTIEEFEDFHKEEDIPPAFLIGNILGEKMDDELTNKKNSRRDIYEKLKKTIRALPEQYSNQYGEKYKNLFKEPTKKALELTDKAWKYIIDRDKNDAILKKIQTTLKSTMIGDHRLEVKTQHYSFLSETENEMVIKPELDFGEKLLQLRSDIRQTHEEYNVKRLSSSSWKSFRDVLRSFFVEFALKYGNFNNMDTCTYQDCQKLFVVTDTRKTFCSEKCKNQFSKDDQRTKCRQNQNRWIDDMKDKRDKEQGEAKEELYFESIEKEDCHDCEETVSRGHCPHIRNRDVLKDYKPKRKKKVYWKKENGVWVNKKSEKRLEN